MKKKLFAILLSIVMVAGLLPATALAAEPTVYDIWVDLSLIHISEPTRPY